METLDQSTMEKENVSVPDSYGFRYLNKGNQLSIEKQYKMINQEVKKIHESGIKDVIEDSKWLKSKLKTCNYLSKTAFETASQKCIEYDGEYFVNASEVNHILLNSLQADNHNFDAMIFAEKLITFINPDSRISVSTDDENTHDHSKIDYFLDLGSKYSYLFKSSPCLSFIYGSFDPGEIIIPVKTRKHSNHPRNFDTKDLKKPKTQDASEIKEINKNGKEVEQLYTLIKNMYDKNQEPVPYFEAVIDPDSFTQSVENIFHSSFLIKEGLISLKYIVTKENFKIPVIESLTPEESKSPKQMKNSSIQSILSFSIYDWKKWTSKRQI